MNAGGYGSGKTLISRQEVYRHLFYTPNANILIGANIVAQYEQTIKRDIENDLPIQLVSYENKAKSFIDFINGGRILYRPLKEAEKLRSLNLTMFVIVEASEVPGSTFAQLKTRLRNPAAFTDKGQDWRRGIVETNPSAGWVRNDVLLNADEIIVHGNTSETYPESLTPDPNMSVHVTATNANKYLPENFIQEQATNKPDWWVRKFLYGSFQYSDGLVYPALGRCIVKSYDIPKHWQRIVACDYGLSDKFTFLAAALNPDPENPKVIFYKNKATNNRNIKELADMFHEFIADIPDGGLYTAPILDPRSGAKRDYNKKTLYDHFLDYGISFQPGHISLDARVFRVNTYLESGVVEIFDTCEELIEEGLKYRFPEKKLDSLSKAKADKPIDKDNHSINPMEWICMALPANPGELEFPVFHFDPSVHRIEDGDPNPYGWQFADNDIENDGYQVHNIF